MKKDKRLGIGLYLVAYTYTRNNQLVSVERYEGRWTQYAYDGDGDRIQKTENKRQKLQNT